MDAEEHWEPEWIDPKTLKAHPENYQFHGEEQIGTLGQSIKKHGVYKTITISQDGYVLAGHGVTEAALTCGEATIPCHRMPYLHDTWQARDIVVTDNETARMAARQSDELSQIMQSILDESPHGLDGTGTTDETLASLLEEVAAQRPPTGFVPPEFREYDENIDLSNVKTATCPECGHEFPV